MKSRNTKQKEIILEVLKNSNNHPTIYELYDMVSKKDNTIGKATVYRNVKKFVKEKKIFVIKTKSGIDRYDYYNQHAHFECLKCGVVYDICDDKIFKWLEKKFISSKFQINNYNILLDGYCEKCQRSKNEKKI